MRFPEFTGEWKEMELNQCCDRLEYGMNAAATEYDGVNKYIRITDIDENTSQYSQNDIVSPLGILEDKYLVKANDILFARTGASTGKTYHYQESDGKLYFAGFLIRAKISYRYNSKFIFYQTQTYQYKKWIGIMSARSGQPGINSQEYGTLPIVITSNEEQDKIARFLSLIDERIATQNKIIEEYKKLKDTLVEKMFAYTNKKPELRFAEYDYDWSKHTYADIFKIARNRNADNNTLKVLSASQQDGMIERDQIEVDIKYNKDNIKSYKIVEVGDYIVHLRSFQGGFAYANINGICSPAYTILRSRNNNLSHSFLKDFFISKKFINTLRLVTYGIRDGKSINVEEFLNLEVRIPTSAEQNRIVNTITSMESKLKFEIELLILLNKQKQYLLTKMFI